MSHRPDNICPVQWVGSITAINPVEWNGITGGDVAVSHGWLQVVEEYGLVGCATEYILLRGRERLIGAVICQTETGAGHVKDIDAYLFGHFKRHASALGISFTPTLFGNARYGYGTHVLVAPSTPDEERLAVMHRLIEATEARACESDMGVCFDRVTAEEALLMQVLQERGYSRTIDLPVAVMNIAWDSQQGYLRHLRSARKNAESRRREIQRNREAGVNIYTLESVTEQEGRLHQLLVDNMKKYNNDRTFELRPGFLSRAKVNIGKNAVIYVAEKQRRLIAIMLLLAGNGTGYMLKIGVDHKMAGNDFTYFNIGYYRPATDASSLGLKRIYFGNSHYDLKVRRGCKLMQTFVYFKSPRWIGNLAAKPFLKMHSAWYRRKLPAIARGE